VAVALIVAAGRGERLGSGRPKALVALSGRPMLHWSVAALRGCPAVARIVVALPADAVDAAPAGVIAVPGGPVRSDSVRLALAAAGPDGDEVIVHDAARPLVTPALFTRALAALRELPHADCVIAALPVADTIKEVEPGGTVVARTLERSRLWAVQTPQVFRRAVLERALRDASAQALASATDDAWLVEQAGGQVHVLPGEPDNFKITVAADLARAERLLDERGR
jgi:2-C-methyl-D-erythritol 4-phosphate cytidylyltransferase